MGLSVNQKIINLLNAHSRSIKKKIFKFDKQAMPIQAYHMLPLMIRLVRQFINLF